MSNCKYAGKIKEFIPKLTPTLHKGQCGRIGIIGGSAEYTGAPYFAAISALKLGADLVYVFCCKEAGPVIKSYSPELIVLPILDSGNVTEKIENWLTRLHALVIGPGLGTKPVNIIRLCNERSKLSVLPLIIDADGLRIVNDNLDLIKKYHGPVILTPNEVEFKRLSSKFSNTEAINVASSLNSVLIQKGSTDVITNGINFDEFDFTFDDVTITCETFGSNRRCGGQGDILSGCIATFVAWFELFKSNNTFIIPLSSVSCYGACAVTKTCSKLAFQKFGRSMTASDMIGCIHQSFTSLFGS
ncbi:conserved hypothetical protein [Pediculus humanus corporis]|uniref:ATP-dependent (S)-NAD(P)H-hydrate dehydratase n=1 Tax=Pediculus humanus subsp. corporis TaxID=121224 RepID=NNRD_PEDHC|nr:uncharacterized protein Phum_PHUM417680 [Pediculus humanus corporis]E0VSF4.1 RecName: Full=ATP-dependent (S)-NAD(P)H-hydrate dehydratase; AltName: Full=ATP-dependent NAD(P)HX dehydratase [Pediculus humanus corporis]EEB16310.1 conserved hypothetical protein [Pediculus humanus corporis]